MNELPLNQILCGDCREVMKDFPDNGIDLVVTDPPYGLSFMGKDWDKTLPPEEAFKQIIRVLKPGAITFVNSSPRQDLFSRMILLLEKVGFRTDVSYIDWIYKTGFPKAYDVSLGIDRKFIIKEFFNEYNRKPSKDELKALLKEKRKVSGRYIHPNGRLRKAENHTPHQLVRNPSHEYGYVTSGFRKTVEPYADEAKKWEGWKAHSGLKPAHEPIIMAYKPLSENTIIDNVFKWNTGAINANACRIPFQNKEDSDYVEGKHDSVEGIPRTGGNTYQWKEYRGKRTNGFASQGRFPANLLVSDRAIDTGELSKSGWTNKDNRTQFFGGGETKNLDANIHYDDIGDQSRYFDLDAWAEHHGFLDVPKPDNAERDFGLRGKKQVPKSKFNLSDDSKDMRFDGVIPKPRRNTHPTVKPIRLMAYLIELGCPPNGIVLDPFMGSGTTCIAAKRLARKYIGIEINPKYFKIAEARIAAYPVPLNEFFGLPPKP